MLRREEPYEFEHFAISSSNVIERDIGVGQDVKVVPGAARHPRRCSVTNTTGDSHCKDAQRILKQRNTLTDLIRGEAVTRRKCAQHAALCLTTFMMLPSAAAVSVAGSSPV
jgi:hypothetical protein